MPLYHEVSPNVFELWTGQPIDDIVHPTNIADLWTPEELAAIGLYEPVAGSVPAGKQIVSSVVERVDGIVTRLDNYEDIPVVVPTSTTKLKLVRSLRAAGRENEFWTALNAAPANIRTDWELATAISRTDPLVLAFAQALNLDSAALDAIFVAAASIPD